MPDQYSEEQKKVLDDLLKEKNLWMIYSESKKIGFSKKFNFYTSWLSFLICLIFSLCLADKSNLPELLSKILEIAFTTSISLLGFLLAGFAFFATIADKKLFFSMAEIPHKESGLSYLKYNFFSFMRVFIEYLVFALISLSLLVVFDKKSGLSEWFKVTFQSSSFYGYSVDQLLFCLLLSCILGTFIYLLLQLKSFIFNIYHVVMTSIYWEILKKYDDENKEAK
ncbi:hypothetical protein [Gimesia chilikensis]|uniref:hypothetical protein n=1 Tax=Gimesia chilikensis TaxID=2605989 RepID=UPI0011892D62|nr:hypothetical protein [Gimesia chilikensis]QDT83831.1 hypothetical protein MalM14_14660 [Gimesia chilikensis]